MVVIHFENGLLITTEKPILTLCALYILMVMENVRYGMVSFGHTLHSCSLVSVLCLDLFTISRPNQAQAQSISVSNHKAFKIFIATAFSFSSSMWKKLSTRCLTKFWDFYSIRIEEFDRINRHWNYTRNRNFLSHSFIWNVEFQLNIQLLKPKETNNNQHNLQKFRHWIFLYSTESIPMVN